MQIPFLDIQAQNRSIWEEIQAALQPVLSEAQFVLGPAVERFEKQFAAYLGVKHCVGLNNGTSALHMALIACNAGAGDEVITTPATWISTSWAISYVGAKPVYVDIDPVTYTLDPARIKTAITPRTRAILPVHLYGQAADLEPMLALAKTHGLVLIEDAAQAHGAFYQGRRVGGIGKVGCFSFYPGKNLGAFGEGGCIVTNDDAVAGRIRCLRDHAQKARHQHVEIGFNNRMEGIQGAVLGAKLPHLEKWNEARRRHARRYQEMLADVPGVVLPRARVDDGHVWHIFSVRVRGRHRDQVRADMAARGVATSVHYPTLVPFQRAYASLEHKPGDFPVAEELFANCLSLPIYPELTDEQLSRVAEVFRESVKS
jgi:dTDP-4-amino-4,6-dideoxygalactose transaminase